jgi:hypothetical protein
MSEFNLGRKPNETEENTNDENYLPANYIIAIRDVDNTTHYLSPVDAYTFLTYLNDGFNSMVVFKNDKLITSFGQSKATPYSIFKQIREIDEKFKDVYETDFFEKKAAGQEVYNPFSAKRGNMNWKSVAKLRKNAIKNVLPRIYNSSKFTYNNRFSAIKQKEPYGIWKGATPYPETIAAVRKLRSRKTRKNRR